MDKSWQKIAQRFVEGLGVQPGELIEVRDGSGRLDILLETSLAIEQAGATPLLQLLSDDYLERLWIEVPQEHLAHWDQFRGKWLKQIDRVLVLDEVDHRVEDADVEGLELRGRAFQMVGGKLAAGPERSAADERPHFVRTPPRHEMIFPPEKGVGIQPEGIVYLVQNGFLPDGSLEIEPYKHDARCIL